MMRRDQQTPSSSTSTNGGNRSASITLLDGSLPPAVVNAAGIRDARSKSADTMRRDKLDGKAAAAALMYMQLQIKEEAADPDIQADSEVSLDANSTLAQVLEDFSNDEAPHEPEIEIKTSSRSLADESAFRKQFGLSTGTAAAAQKSLQFQLGNMSYQLADQMFKPTPVNLLTKDMLEQKITEKDPELVYRKHHNNNSTWARYMPMYYKGVKQNYVRCLECGWLVLHKASTGTGSLLRHKCKIKLPSGVEVKIEQQPASNRNLPTKQTNGSGGGASATAAAAKFQTTAMPQNVIDDLVRQQACFLYKDLSSVELFDSSSFRTFAQMLVNVGVYYGQQDIGFLADKSKLLDRIIPSIYQQARMQLNQALVDCDLSYSLSMFRNEAEQKSYVTVNSYTVAEDYYFRKINVKTVQVDELDEFVGSMPTIIPEILEREQTEPLKLVYGSKLNVPRSEEFELIPCVVTALWGIMKKIMDMFEFDSEQYVEKIFLAEDDDEDEDAMKKILAPFKEPLRSLVADGTATISEVVLWKKKLEKHFRVEEADDENMKTIKEAFQMQIKQSLKLHDYHKIAVFLDPKFKGLRFLTEEERVETLAIVKAQLARDQDGIEQLRKLHSSGKKNVDIQKESKFYEFMDLSLEVESSDVVDDEIRQYVDVKLEAPVDVLSYWRTECSFPLLKKLCQRVLNIPAACDDMKLRFGRADQLDFLKKRAVLREEEIDMMLYLNQNGP
uniref:Zinc finger protein 618 n=1 Tax=Culex pipiens TaxID=7175 RepID=A0A8D8DM61_CULPI